MKEKYVLLNERLLADRLVNCWNQSVWFCWVDCLIDFPEFLVEGQGWMIPPLLDKHMLSCQPPWQQALFPAFHSRKPKFLFTLLNVKPIIRPFWSNYMCFFILLGRTCYFEYQWYQTVCVEFNHEAANYVHFTISAVNWFLEREKWP